LEPSRHPVWAVFALSAAAVLVSLVILAFGPRADSGQRPTSVTAQAPSGASTGSPGAAGGTGTASSAAAVASPVAAAAGPQAVAIEMGDYYYRPAEIAVLPGEIQFSITNLARRRHTFNIQNAATGVDLLEVDLGANQSTTRAFTPPAPGTYRIYCNITDHAERGQVGTLTVGQPGRS